MFVTMVRRSVVRGWRKRALAMLTVAIGTALTVAMLNVSLDVQDKVGRELKGYGANILVTPKTGSLHLGSSGLGSGGAGVDPPDSRGYLPEDEVAKIKTIFWQNNIVAFAPYLEVEARAPGVGEVSVVGTWFRKTLVIPTGETVTTGARDLKSWWQIDGAWVDDESGGGSALVGKELAERLSLRPGDSLRLTFGADGGRDRAISVSGIVAAGGAEDRQVYVPLAWLQEASGHRAQVSRVEVSALTIPKNELARKAESDPDSLSRAEFDTWYCSPYVDSVTYQIEEVIPEARARPVRQIAESEGVILSKVQLLMAFLSMAAVASSALGIAGLMGAAALERSAEIGLLKALGAQDSSVTWLFLAEALPIAVVGGAAGFVGGIGLAGWLAARVFGMLLEPKMITLPAAFVIALGVTLLGLLSVARIIARLAPARILVGR